MPRISIHYDDGSTVDANDMADVLNHVTVNSARGVVDVREEVVRQECPNCKGAGVLEPKEGKRLLTRKQLEDKVAEVATALTDAKPDADIDEVRIRASRKAAKS